jgi:predicted RNase H-like nuclease (RuvC/YqgF family)
MNEIEELKKKLKAIEKRKIELDQREAVINAMLPLGNALSTKMRSKTLSNRVEMFREIAESFGSKIESLDNTDEMLEALERQTKTLENKDSKKIVREMKNLLKEFKKFESKTFFDQDAFNKVFSEGMSKILNAISVPDELPEEVSYSRRQSDNKITKVTEQFGKYRLVHKWSYDGKGNLKEVSTRRVDETA